MSVVTAVKYLAEFAAEALRPWDPSRELAARMLADLPLMVRLREDDSATADEVTYLVLGRFLPGEPPTVEGADFLGDVEFTNCHPDSDLPPCWHGSDEPGWGKADAATLVAEAVAVLDEPCCNDHDTICAVIGDAVQACCPTCPEFVKSVTP